MHRLYSFNQVALHACILCLQYGSILGLTLLSHLSVIQYNLHFLGSPFFHQDVLLYSYMQRVFTIDYPNLKFEIGSGRGFCYCTNIFFYLFLLSLNMRNEQTEDSVLSIKRYLCQIASMCSMCILLLS